MEYGVTLPNAGLLATEDGPVGYDHKIGRNRRRLLERGHMR